MYLESLVDTTAGDNVAGNPVRRASHPSPLRPEGHTREAQLMSQISPVGSDNGSDLEEQAYTIFPWISRTITEMRPSRAPHMAPAEVQGEGEVRGPLGSPAIIHDRNQPDAGPSSNPAEGGAAKQVVWKKVVGQSEGWKKVVFNLNQVLVEARDWTGDNIKERESHAEHLRPGANDLGWNQVEVGMDLPSGRSRDPSPAMDFAWTLSRPLFRLQGLHISARSRRLVHFSSKPSPSYADVYTADND